MKCRFVYFRLGHQALFLLFCGSLIVAAAQGQTLLMHFRRKSTGRVVTRIAQTNPKSLRSLLQQLLTLSSAAVLTSAMQEAAMAFASGQARSKPASTRTESSARSANVNPGSVSTAEADPCGNRIMKWSAAE